MRAHTWALRALVGMAALVIPAKYVHAQLASAASSKPAAIVNGEPITWAELLAAEQSRPPTWSEPTAQQRRNFRMAVLQVLIDQKLLEQFMRRHGARLNPADIKARMNDLEAGCRKDGKTVEDFCKANGVSMEQLKSSLICSIQWEIYARSRITEADVRRYYEDNRDFFDQVMVRVSRIELVVPVGASAADGQSVRQSLLAIRQQIVSGKLDFAEAARKYSHCPISRDRGGDLGYLPRKFSAEEEPFIKAAFTLPVGQISDVITTSEGMHLIKVTDRKAGQPFDYEKGKGLVREMCSSDLLQSELAHQRQSAQVKIQLPE